MGKSNKLLIVTGILVILVSIGYFPYHKWARKHTNWATATEDHPVNCFSCHLYTINRGPAATLINANYVSPFNLAVSNDGSQLFVVSEEANCLLVVNLEDQKVLHKINVGKMPHSLVLSRDEKTAFVTNQLVRQHFKSGS